MGRNPEKDRRLMFTHDLHFTHTRHPLSNTFGVPEASSSVAISVDSTDLVEAWAELLSRMPPDLYAGLKTAMDLASR